VVADASRPSTSSPTAVSPAAGPDAIGSVLKEREGLAGSLEGNMAKAPVVVLATALDWTPAPPSVPGDRAENLIRYRVKRVLKGQLNQEFVTTQTPTAAGELIGKDWVLLLSPDFLAGKHRYAECVRASPDIVAMAAGNAAAAPPRAVGPQARVEGLRRKSLDQSVAEAQVIVVATALDSAPAAPKVRGDAPENLIRFRVARVLKGRLTQEIITTRTPTAPAEFIGHDWIVMLSPEYMNGNHLFAGCYTIRLEAEVKAMLAKGSK
jgi:hypothetical protein